MAEIVLFHHIQGLTPGVTAIADRLAAAGHTVHTPDLYDGHTFDRMEDGFAFAQALERDDVRAQADAAVSQLPDALVFAGISWSVSQAQRLAQARPGARGAVLLEACYPITGEWALGPWPDGLAAQIHGMDRDEFFALEGDLDAARELAAASPGSEVFTYPGDRHLFVDSSLPSYDRDAAELVLTRILEFVAER